MIPDDEYQYQREITCPYCSDKFPDSWEVNKEVVEGSLGIIECPSCEKKFTASREVTIYYTSEPTPCQNGETEHVWEKCVGVPKELFERMYFCRVCGEIKRLTVNAKKTELSKNSKDPNDTKKDMVL